MMHKFHIFQTAEEFERLISKNCQSLLALLYSLPTIVPSPDYPNAWVLQGSIPNVSNLPLVQDDLRNYASDINLEVLANDENTAIGNVTVHAANLNVIEKFIRTLEAYKRKQHAASKARTVNRTLRSGIDISSPKEPRERSLSNDIFVNYVRSNSFREGAVTALKTTSIGNGKILDFPPK